MDIGVPIYNVVLDFSFVFVFVYGIYIKRAKGMTQIAKDTGLGRESLYKSFQVGAKPRFDTVMKVLNSFGVGLRAVC